MTALARTSKNFGLGLTGRTSLWTAVLSRETRPREKPRKSPPSAARPMRRGGGDCLRRGRNGKWVSAGGARWPQVSRAGPARPGPAVGALTLQAVKPAPLCSPVVALGFLGGDLGARCQQQRRSEIREPLAREGSNLWPRGGRAWPRPGTSLVHSLGSYCVLLCGAHPAPLPRGVGRGGVRPLCGWPGRGRVVQWVCRGWEATRTEPTC